MNLAEVMAAAIVLACACSGSLQIWAASAAASHSLAARQEQLVRLDGALLAAQARLRTSRNGIPPATCLEAAEWMEAELDSAPRPDGVQLAADQGDGGVWLRVQGENLPPRQRWLDAAALGLCSGPPQTSPPPVNPEINSGNGPAI